MSDKRSSPVDELNLVKMFEGLSPVQAKELTGRLRTAVQIEYQNFRQKENDMKGLSGNNMARPNYGSEPAEDSHERKARRMREASEAEHAARMAQQEAEAQARAEAEQRAALDKTTYDKVLEEAAHFAQARLKEESAKTLDQVAAEKMLTELEPLRSRYQELSKNSSRNRKELDELEPKWMALEREYEQVLARINPKAGHYYRGFYITDEA